MVLAESGLPAAAPLPSRRSAELARQAADEFSTAAKPRFVAGSVGPTTKAITVTGGVTFEELREAYFIQTKALVEGGVDLLLIETSQDTRNIKAALLAIQRLSREIGQQVPFIISVTIEPIGSMLAGQAIEAMWPSLLFATPLAFAMDGATGAKFTGDQVRTLSQVADEFGAGGAVHAQGEGEGKYLETPTS